MKKLTPLFFALALPCLLFAQSGTAINLLRHPALSSDGSKVAFSYQGDIWVADTDGGAARRLTIHEGYDSHPQWSPLDDQLLFKSNRYGNDDLFTIPASGGRPVRLTYHSASDESARWEADGQIVFTSRRIYAQVEREDEIMTVSREGGTPVRLMDALGLMPSPSPDGRYIAFVRGNCRVVREAYQGPANRQIWVYDTQEDSYRQITKFEGQDVYPDWGPDNTLYFLSARNKRYNLYRMKMSQDEEQAEALTSFADEGIRYFDLSADGSTVVCAQGAQVFVMDTKAGATPRPLSVALTGDYRFDPVERKTYTDELSGYALSPDNKMVALEIRGELFVMPEDKEQKRSARLTKLPARDQSPAWLNDSTLLFLSDRAGNSDLYLLRSSDEEEPSLYRTFKREIIALTTTMEEETGFTLSPDRSKIAMLQGRGKLIVADIDSTGSISNQQALLDG